MKEDDYITRFEFVHILKEVLDNLPDISGTWKEELIHKTCHHTCELIGYTSSKHRVFRCPICGYIKIDYERTYDASL